MKKKNAKKKAEFSKVTIRVSDDFVAEFEEWFPQHKKQYDFITRNAVQAEALYRIVKSNRKKFPWEG